MAVLEKRAGLLLQNQDAYLKSAGGVKLDEPAIDLASCSLLLLRVTRINQPTLRNVLWESWA